MISLSGSLSAFRLMSDLPVIFDTIREVREYDARYADRGVGLQSMNYCGIGME
jgi:hypothetical protein